MLPIDESTLQTLDDEVFMATNSMQSPAFVEASEPPVPTVVLPEPNKTCCRAFCANIHPPVCPTIRNVSPNVLDAGRVNVIVPALSATYPVEATTVCVVPVTF